MKLLTKLLPFLSLGLARFITPEEVLADLTQLDIASLPGDVAHSVKELVNDLKADDFSLDPFADCHHQQQQDEEPELFAFEGVEDEPHHPPPPPHHPHHPPGPPPPHPPGPPPPHHPHGPPPPPPPPPPHHPPGPPPPHHPPGPPPPPPPPHHAPPPHHPPGPPPHHPPGPPPHHPPGPPPHHPPGPPHHPPGPPADHPPDGPHHPPHRRPHPPHHPHHPPHKSNKTIYQLISEHKQVSKFAALVEKDEDTKKLLNSSSAGVTVFIPTNKALEKLPKRFPLEEHYKDIIAYHIVPEVKSAKDILKGHTLPTLLEGEHLSDKPSDTPQRLSTQLTLRGITINHYARVIFANGIASNGIIHAIDNIVFPPIPAKWILDVFPQYFSTLQLALLKVGFFDEKHPHEGGTFFAPTNSAWQRLGPKVNGFLFSPPGRKYLKALLDYHISFNNTLYSDKYYANEESSATDIPKGQFHVDLKTELKDRSLSIDIIRWGGLIDIKINGYNRVTLQDGIVRDGVIHVPSNILIPPRKVNGKDVHHDGGVLSIEELKERLDPLVQEEKDESMEL